MESMVNLVDVMLVFICGLLISIIIYWNINMKNLVIILDQKQLVKIDNPKEVTEQMKAVSAYGDVGFAVRDPKTGNLYVMDNKDKTSGAKAGEKTVPGNGAAEKGEGAN
ncbi:MAG TPA: DUF2149 domain-containing protein [Syntrophomonadaceae bacterium]|nr:DUF2149 domain-containing protein [Syntrophomonadaceae bacterium]